MVCKSCRNWSILSMVQARLDVVVPQNPNPVIATNGSKFQCGRLREIISVDNPLRDRTPSLNHFPALQYWGLAGSLRAEIMRVDTCSFCSAYVKAGRFTLDPC